MEQEASREKRPVGVIGAGSFGTAMAMLMAHNQPVLLYARNSDLVKHLNAGGQHKGIVLPKAVRATADLAEIGAGCDLIFPIVPSKNFRALMRNLSPYVTPAHILIHGTKGLDTGGSELRTARHVLTMSDVILQESAVVRIGCLSGPNISREILEGQPAATVVASRFQEVIDAGKEAIRGPKMQVYSNRDIRGAELAGALKNIIALGSGVLGGLGLGKNIWGLLITRGLTEMIHFGQALGADVKPFLGVAGIGDLVTTASSTASRNYSLGYRIGQGESLASALDKMDEVAEGAYTVQLAKQLADQYQLKVPITRMVHRILYENYPASDALDFLIRLSYAHDVDYL